ncbi:MAG: DUF3592 domain-containing protein [Bacilli bacterium]|nr:DUF3592 domain-containing protein [Bacilli bacterium]
MYTCWILIFIAAIMIMARIIFRIRTRHYEETVGQIVDFHTKAYYRHKDGHTSYQHKPIVEFFANGRTYRCVKPTPYYSRVREWDRSLVKSSYRDYVRVRYNPSDPRKSYCLFTIKDFKYNIIMIIPMVVLVLILFLYEWLHS